MKRLLILISIATILLSSTYLQAEDEVDLTTPPNVETKEKEPSSKETTDKKKPEEKVDLTTPPSVEKDQAVDQSPVENTAKVDISDPTDVYFYIFVLDIDEINGAKQSFIANMYMRARWMDQRLKHNEAAARRVPLDSIWHPQMIIANPKGLIRKSLDETALIEPDGTITHQQHYVGTLGQPLELQDFPIDQHTFSIQFAAVGDRDTKINFVPDNMEAAYTLTGGDISANLSLPDWEIIEYQGIATPFEPISTVLVPGFAFEFTAKRRTLYYYFQIIIPLAVVVAMSWGAFWIDPSLASSQIGVATSSILSLIAYRFVLAGLLPRLPYMTRLDYLMLGSTVLVFLAMVEVITTCLLSHHNHSIAAKRLDIASRVLFPSAFTALFFWSLYS